MQRHLEALSVQWLGYFASNAKSIALIFALVQRCIGSSSSALKCTFKGALELQEIVGLHEHLAIE
jgi:hypothetical protein